MDRRLMAALGMEPPAREALERAAGTVDPDASFAGVWQEVPAGGQVVIRQHGDRLFVSKHGRGTTKWSVDGSTAFYCGFEDGESAALRRFSVCRAELLGPTAMHWDVEVAVVEEPFGPVKRHEFTIYWERLARAE